MEIQPCRNDQTYLYNPKSRNKRQTRYRQNDCSWLPATFSQFKEGSGPINEAKAPEWLDAKVKTRKFDISNDDRPKMAKIGDYWSEEKTIEIVNLLKNFQDVFSQDYIDIKGLVHEMGEMKIDTKPNVRPVKKRP